MAGFGNIFSDWLNLPWEQARTFIKDELESLRLVLSKRWGAVFGPDNALIADAISGDKTKVPRYVANTGKNFKPQWDLVDVQVGVKNRLQFSHLKAATQPSVLVGRESGSAGDFEEITLGSELTMTGVVLNTRVLLEDYVVASNGATPPAPADNGASSFIYVAYNP